jgi:hypothetical protein
MKRNLKSIAQFATDSPFSQGQLRWWVFNAETNGLAAAGAVVRVQRRVYIDADCFEAWIDSQNSHAAAAAQ